MRGIFEQLPGDKQPTYTIDNITIQSELEMRKYNIQLNKIIYIQKKTNFSYYIPYIEVGHKVYIFSNVSPRTRGT
jgi:hypothetical protein